MILTRQWHDSDAGQSLVFWLASDSGPARIVLTSQESILFVSQLEIPKVEQVLSNQISWRYSKIALRTFADKSPVAACYFRSQRDLGFARLLLQQEGIDVFESDVRPTDRYLMERYVRGAMEVEGDGEENSTHIVFQNPKIRAADCLPSLKVVSLDIETSITHKHVLSIAVHGSGLNKVFMLGEGTSSLDYVEFVADEAGLLRRFVDWFKECDPDIVIGWSVVGFDLRYLQDRCDFHAVPFVFGRGDETISWRTIEQGAPRTYAVVPGRVVLDGIELLRTATYQFESFSLENVARELLGRGKLVHNVDARAHEIEEMHRTDKDALARYNLEDCALVADIFAETELIAFAIQRAKLTGLEMDRQGGSVAAFDYLYLPRLHRAGYVAPVVDEDSIVHSPGGFVLDSEPGIHQGVVVLDFKSLYPSIIRTFHVDPLAMISDGGDQIPGFLDAEFSKTECILPNIIEELWLARDVAKNSGDGASSQAIKIIMNSFYGVLGTPGCRFFDPRLASSITKRGHEILQTTRNLIEQQGFRVIYGDTDSVFVLIERPANEINATAANLASDLNRWWRQHLTEEYGVTSYLELEFETHFEKFLMPTVRGSDKGSKKRYAGMLWNEDPGRKTMVFKGLETVRSDWSPLAREFQQELYRRVFMEEPVEEYVKKMVQQVLDGDVDDKLVLRRRLRRKLSDYTKNVPPHVKAARLADEQRMEAGLAAAFQHGGWVSYRMTVNGPEPIEYSKSLPDYDFYIERQLAPVADAILGFQNLSLQEITDKQLGLF